MYAIQGCENIYIHTYWVCIRWIWLHICDTRICTKSQTRICIYLKWSHNGYTHILVLKNFAYLFRPVDPLILYIYLISVYSFNTYSFNIHFDTPGMHVCVCMNKFGYC